MQRFVITAAILVGSMLGCTQPREIQQAAACDSYRDTIAPTLTAACVQCHGATQAEAGYRLDSYSAILQQRPDGTPRVVAGDAGSLLLRRATGEGGHPRANDVTLSTLHRWVTVCDLAYFASDAGHPQGFVNPSDEDFHGHALATSGWDFADCARCHGDANEASGGTTGRSCLTCHTEGPTSCNTCHGNLASGAHRVHVEGGAILDLVISCDQCHVVPTDWRDAGHLFLADNTLDTNPRAEVIFDGSGSYDAATYTCGNTTCHAGSLAAAAPAPVWTATGNNGCATCHGSPPGGNAHHAEMALTDCADCHGLVVDATGAISDASLHLDGAVSLGDGSATCAACHGNPPTTGAHAAHVGSSTFSAPLACSACHTMPTGATFDAAVASAGHVDSAPPAEVFPGGAEFAGLAAAAGFVPTFDHASGDCTSYCHSFESNAPISWTAGGTVVCGGCHALPPPVELVPQHFNKTYPDDCDTCHGNTVNPDGTIKFQVDGTTLHINGAVN